MEDIFDIEKFNIISDSENYYFFRSLEPGDIEDLEKGIIKDGENYIRLRTDRERWNETHERQAKYTRESTLTLDELYSHIRNQYSLETNCISLTSNANVARMYGEQFSQNYVMITVPKKEMGEKIVSAGPYVLKEIEKRVEQELTKELPEKIKNTISQIEEAENAEKLKEILKEHFRSKEKLEEKTPKMKKGIIYKTPTVRVSRFQALTEEQNLYKNKVIAKLTILEKNKMMEPIIPHSKDNKNFLLDFGGAFSTSEQTYYGDIDGKNIVDISRDMLDILSLLQQVEGIEKTRVHEVEKQVVELVKNKVNIQVPEEKEYISKENATIEEIYNLTEGKVEYGKANSIITNVFYLAKAQSRARTLAQVLRNILEENNKYEDIIQYIEKKGFEIEPKIVTRTSNKGYKINETVNLNLRQNEIALVEQIRELTDKEQAEILQAGGMSNVREILTSNFSQIQSKEEISKDKYYAEAIISLYDWEKIGIEEFTVEERNNLLKRIQEEHCIELYNKLQEERNRAKQNSDNIIKYNNTK